MPSSREGTGKPFTKMAAWTSQAHYTFRASNGSVVEVLSNGTRAGSAAVLKHSQRGEAVSPREYYFRTAVRFRAGAPFGYIGCVASPKRVTSMGPTCYRITVDHREHVDAARQ